MWLQPLRATVWHFRWSVLFCLEHERTENCPLSMMSVCVVFYVRRLVDTNNPNLCLEWLWAVTALIRRLPTDWMGAKQPPAVCVKVCCWWEASLPIVSSRGGWCVYEWLHSSVFTVFTWVFRYYQCLIPFSRKIWMVDRDFSDPICHHFDTDT